MRFRKLAVLVLSAACLLPVWGQTALRFGIFPVYDAKTTIRLFQPIADRLAEAIGRPVTLVSSPDGKVFRERALAGSYDIMWSNNAVYLALRENGMVSVIARGEPSFRGMVVVLKDAPYASVSDLKGARIVAVSPESVAGFLFLRKLFLNAGMDIYKDTSLSFSSKVESIPFLVVNGKADAGVFVEDLYMRSPTYDAAMARLRILVKSPPIPQFPFVVKKGMDASTVQTLKETLSGIDGSSEEERSFLYELKLDRFMSADDASYDAFSIFYKEMQS